MSKEHSQHAASSTDSVAYLVIREGNTWRDVYRLNPGQVTTVGRAPTNRIVLRDDICSRKHSEFFFSSGNWTVRDLNSRNGTLLNDVPISGDCIVEEGDIVGIGSSEIGFTFDLANNFPRFEQSDDFEDDTAQTIEKMVFDHPATEAEPSIIHRTGESRYRQTFTPEPIAREGINHELTLLYSLALEMGSCGDEGSLSKVVLDGLLSGTRAEIGAILLLPENADREETKNILNVVAYKSRGELPYQKISQQLSQEVLENREAVLASNVSDDSRLAGRDSEGRIHATSLICAPIRTENTTFGLIHLYATDAELPVDIDDLELTLAIADQFAVALQNLKERESLADGLARVRDENLTLRQQLEINCELVGESNSISELRDSIGRIAPTDAAVLVRGESGVGKELLAKAIHFSSKRKNEQFVCMNCAALTESLLESELFGHEKGSFTGATERKIGKFEQADKGTLFLDEVGEMGLAIQAKFLRVLEGHSFERVGGKETISLDVRVVAATNRDLEQAVQAGTFRKDLYFRLHVVEMKIDPLREHKSDIPLLANFFLDKFARKSGQQVQRFSPDALSKLMRYDWPGNVRELQNTIERAVILCDNSQVREKDIRLTQLEASSSNSAKTQGLNFREVSLEIIEQEHILSTLERTNWNKSQAAGILGIERSTLDRKLKRYRISRP